jgi:hypothetical protein
MKIDLLFKLNLISVDQITLVINTYIYRKMYWFLNTLSNRNTNCKFSLK